MKNYVAPKSVVLSMNMNENIAISTESKSLERKINTNTGVWVTSTLIGNPEKGQAIDIEELFAMAMAHVPQAELAWEECK